LLLAHDARSAPSGLADIIRPTPAQFRNDLEQVPRRTKVGDFQGGASSSLLNGTMMTASLMPIICRIALAVPVAAQEFGAVILL